MDKEELRIKLEKINELVEKKDYKSAMEIIDSIDWRREKNVRTLCSVGEIYAANKRYEDSKEIFLLAYNRAPIGKSILYRLIEVSLKMGDVSEAEDFYEEYLEIAANDNTRFILKYKIQSVKKAPIEELIQILEEYKSHEYTERWSYELAKLYYKVDNKKKCIETCDDLILWFSEGKYVTRALDLKMRLGSLTKSQRQQYEEALTPKLKTKEELDQEKEIKNNEGEESENQIETLRIPKESGEAGSILEATGIFQEKITKGIKDIFSGKRKENPLEFQEEEEKQPEKEEFFREEEKENIDGMLEDYSNSENIPSLEPENIGLYHAKEPEELKIPNNIKIPEPIEAQKAMTVPAYVLSKKESKAALEADEMQNEKLAAKEENNPEEEIEKTEEIPKEKDFLFNFEKTILAAANAQGIEVSMEEDISEKAENTESVETAFEEELAEELEDFLEEAKEEPVQEKLEEEIVDIDDHTQIAESEQPLEEFPNKKDIESVSHLEEPVSKEPILDEAILDDKAFEEPTLEEIPEEAIKEPVYSEEELLEQFIDERIKEPESDGLFLIPREKKLDDTEQKIFSYFSSIPGIPEQLAEALLDVQQAAADKTSKTGNVIIMGAIETGKTRLSQAFILSTCRELNMEAAKSATVDGKLMNEREPAEVIDKLSGGFLVIEHAAQMSAETIEKLNQAMEFRTDGLTIIIEDEKIGMRKLIAKYPKFAKKFTSMINIPVFTNDELVNFAKIYTSENGYVMDQMGVLSLYNLIGDNQKEDEPMTIGKVKEMIDNAINRAESGTRRFKRNLSNRRTDEEGKVILYEKDFG